MTRTRWLPATRSSIPRRSGTWGRTTPSVVAFSKDGKTLKKVGRAARLELKEELGRPVHLDLWVKVKDNWADSEKDLLRLGYETP